ncbi:MAG: hypothetical protein IKB23_08640 [Clostridia bacterium]|nr:hypothetical protein [Clostridia bacterium]
MNRIEINVDKVLGKIKPMHAVNNPPTAPQNFYQSYEKLQAANIPYARLHDTGGPYGASVYVDIANVFPNFDADETLPQSYDFAFTDVLLKEMQKYGLKPFYRLGSTIENYHYIKSYNIYPPKDFAKWARICEHIVRHYNEGWADGYRMDIEYWEIWNEPDNEPEIKDNPCWKGTKEQFFELYEITSKHLKKCFPHLKIGGYASCGFYELTGTDVSSVANSTPRTEYFIEFFHEFLQYSEKHGSIIDFFSWHSYADVKNNVYYAKFARQKMNEYGYSDCEIVLNEWNPGRRLRGTQRDASEILSMMIALQNTPTDMCMYYDAEMRSVYCGIFDPVSHGVFNAYYSFYIFGQLYAMGQQVECRVEGEDIYAISAKDDDRVGVVIVNNSEKSKEIDIHIASLNVFNARVYLIDEQHSFEEITLNSKTIFLNAYSILYLEFGR